MPVRNAAKHRLHRQDVIAQPGTGVLECQPYRRTTWVRTCIAQPQPESALGGFLSSQAAAAVTNGLRGRPLRHRWTVPDRRRLGCHRGVEVGGAPGLGEHQAGEPGVAGAAGDVRGETQRLRQVIASTRTQVNIRPAVRRRFPHSAVRFWQTSARSKGGAVTTTIARPPLLSGRDRITIAVTVIAAVGAGLLHYGHANEIPVRRRRSGAGDAGLTGRPVGGSVGDRLGPAATASCRPPWAICLSCSSSCSRSRRVSTGW